MSNYFLLALLKICLYIFYPCFSVAVNEYQNSFQGHDKFYGNDFAYRENQGQITKKPRLQTLQNLYKHSQGQEGRTVPSFIPPMPMQPPQLQVPYYYQQPQPLAKEVSYRMAQEGTGNPTSFQSDQKSLFIGQAQPFQQMQIPGQMPEQGQSEQSLHFFPPQKIYIPENQQFPLEHKDDQQNQQQQFINQQQFGLQLPQKIPQPTERTTQPPIEQPCPMMGDQKPTILLDSPSIEAFNSPLIASKSVDLSSESENLRDAFSPETIALSEDVEKLAEKTEKEKELQTVNDSYGILLRFVLFFTLILNVQT